MAIGANWKEVWADVWGPVWAPEGAPPSSRTVTLQLVAPAGAARAGLSSLKWAFFDSASFPSNLAAGPIDTGTAEATDGAGAILIDLPNSTLDVGETGWLIISSSDGTATQSPPSMAFCAPVVVG